VSTAGSADRAVGFRINGAPTGLKKGSVGVVFENNTGVTLASLDVGYHGEQWYRGASNQVTTLAFQYRIESDFANINNDIDRAQSGWIAHDPLSWGVTNTLSANVWQNGKANSADFSSTISGLTLNDGELLIMRWRIPLTGDNENALIIDDVTVNNFVAVPEPTAFALIGLSGSAWLLLRRRLGRP
jgi:hypothetical protein